MQFYYYEVPRVAGFIENRMMIARSWQEGELVIFGNRVSAGEEEKEGGDGYTTNSKYYIVSISPHAHFYESGNNKRW